MMSQQPKTCRKRDFQRKICRLNHKTVCTFVSWLLKHLEKETTLRDRRISNVKRGENTQHMDCHYI